MRWPFTTFGTGTMLAFALPLIGLAIVLALTVPGFWWLAPVPLVLFILSFFRDPERSAPGSEDDLVSPADGLVSDIVTVTDPALGVPCRRIGIFLSVFNVHVNRVPCAGEVTEVLRRDGLFLDARDPRCAEENQAATIVLARPDGRRVAVRQITGLIARRIVCPVGPGLVLSRGQRYGMIKFGSRTELIVPESDLGEVLAKVGDSVAGGASLLATLTPVAGDGAPGSAPASTAARSETRA